MKFTVSIKLDGEDFKYNRTEKIIACLNQIISKLEKGVPSYAVFDSDFNKCGRFDTKTD